MAIRNRNSEGVASSLASIRERPLLFVALALTTCAGMILAAVLLMEPQTVEAKIRTEIIELDSEAEDLSSLTRPASFDLDGLRARILSLTEPDPGNAGKPPITSLLHDRLEIVEGRNDEVVFCIRSYDVPEAIEEMDDFVSTLIQHLDRERVTQKEEAATWILERITAQQAKIDAAKSTILQSPFRAEASQDAPQTDDEDLLRLLIDATMNAQGDPAETGPSSSPEHFRSDDAAVHAQLNGTDNGLTVDLERMTDVRAEMQLGLAEQFELGTILEDAEADLAALYDANRTLFEKGGVFDRSAADILAPAAVSGTRASLLTNDWRVLLPLSAALGLLLAFLGVLAASRVWPTPPIRSEDYLNDPNWPLPANAHRELSS